MKDIVRKGIIAGKALEAFFPEDMAEVLAETKPSRAMGRGYSDKAHVNNYGKKSNVQRRRKGDEWGDDYDD